MAIYFNFDNLIDKYSVDFTLLTKSNDDYDDLGDKITDSIEETQKRGAIFGISDTKIYKSNGVYTEKDKQLYAKESLGKIDELYVIYDGNKYKVEQQPNAGDMQFTGVCAYVLKWVSAFD